MRLVCPSCGARYEVDDGAIPQTGRDVQCSACDHGWFQPGQAMLKAEPSLAAAPRAGTIPRRALNDDLLAILREEAEREAARRRAESAQEMETQEAFNLEDPEANTRLGTAAATQPAGRHRPAPDFGGLDDDAKGDDDAEGDVGADPGDEGTQPPQARRGRERLPDIEDISSTLAAAADRNALVIVENSPEKAARRGSGFTAGFLTVVGIAALLIMVYAFAPRIVVKLPQIRGALETYVVAIDEGRIWLDARLQSMIDKMQPSDDKVP